MSGGACGPGVGSPPPPRLGLLKDELGHRNNFKSLSEQKSVELGVPALGVVRHAGDRRGETGREVGKGFWDVGRSPLALHGVGRWPGAGRTVEVRHPGSLAHKPKAENCPQWGCV